ncbi:uncharacterized protein LOC132713490 [Ruditapes philippinarum]|uniref:uncharacterized protein LOC132713490 n=1 Tax=Ruditapes philippinarum TaxID=129788 RepID=UPI00295C1F95|nr:uncharacterized protein LOC132713490 [Ruditapes philippinarum]
MKIKGPKTTRYKSLEETIIVPIGEPLRFDLTAREEITDDSSDDDEPAPPPAKKLDEPKRVTKEVAEPTPSVSSHPRQPDTAVEEKKEPKENVKTLLNVIIGVDRGSMLCDARIILYLIASVLFSMGIGIPFCFYPDVSRQYGFSDTKAEWTLSLIGLGSCIGVVFSGFFRQILSNKLECVSRMLVFVTLLFAGLAVGFVHYYTTYGVLLFSALLFGIFYSTFYFLRRNILHEIVSEDYFTSAYYLSYWICGIGYLIGIPISGWFKDTYNTHTWSFLMAAVCFGVGALLIFPLIFMKRKQ